MDKYSPIEALSHIAELIDNATDNNLPKQAELALEYSDYLEKSLDDRQLVELNYLRANAWSVIRLAKHTDKSMIWKWEQSEILKEIYYLRLAVRSTKFTSLEPFRQCQILVNTGNILNHIGRPVEAIEYWRRAINLMPNFAMALGNLGYGLEVYARYLYDSGHQAFILKDAFKYLKAANGNNVVWDSIDYEKIAASMLNRAEEIEQHLDFNCLNEASLYKYSLGKSKAECSYNTWVLDNNLFLSPLNDLGPYPMAAQDVLHLPNMVRPISEPPQFIGFFNQIKQEYAAARFFCWEGINKSGSYKKHYSDKNVLILNTLDYPMHSVFVELSLLNKH